MKKTSILILGVFMLTFLLNTKAQTIDSTQIKLNYLIDSNKKLQNDIGQIKLNLKQCHEVYRAGLWVSGIGIGITSLGAYLKSDGVIYSGSALMLVGGGALIYSHTYIKKAGIGINNNGLTVCYKL